MIIVSPREVSGRDCITLQDGQQVYERLHPLLAADMPVTLDFSGVAVLTFVFLNAAVGSSFGISILTG